MKKVIIIIITIMIIISTLLFMLVSYSNRQDVNEKKQGKLETVTDENILFLIKEKIDLYLELSFLKDDDGIISIIDQNYIQKNKITKENINNYIQDLSMYEDIPIQDEIMILGCDNAYSISSKLKSKDQKTIDFKAILIVDSKNNTFSVYPYKYMEEKKYLNLKENDDFSIVIHEIEKNEYNEIETYNLSSNEIAEKYYSEYMDLIGINPMLAYDKLNDEYKTIKFNNSYNSFEKYLENNNFGFISYSYEKEIDGVKVYKCVDTYGRNIIIEEIGLLNYNVCLDNYSINNKLYLNEINNANEQDRLMLNIDRFVEQINIKDYESAYNNLDEGFRDNNFSNITEFENFVKQYFYDSNDIRYGEFHKVSANIYSYSVTIKNVNNIKENRDVTMMIQLNKRVDCKVSFTING